MALQGLVSIMISYLLLNCFRRVWCQGCALQYDPIAVHGGESKQEQPSRHGH